MEGYEYILIAVGFVLLILSYLLGIGNKTILRINDKITPEDIEDKNKFISDIALPPALIGIAIIVATFIFRISKFMGILIIGVVSIYSLAREFRLLYNIRKK
ncbi:hypothetical protein [Clostridium sp. C8-1-8]|uniref:hypothetical protein n=1 Tax=Clostridium sp. C8-1-8 TaxID=2698831 RepID=UPI00136CBC74|nr:hypothetical protein [Clostridium sp. C8-1-8]